MTTTKATVIFDLNGKVVTNACESFVLSKRYIHIMTEAALFNIICQRINVNESELECRKYEGVPYFAINSKLERQKDPRISQFLSWLKGIKDAINKNYLKVIYMFLLTPEKEVLESYTLKFKYNTDPNNNTPGKRTPNYVKECTKSLLEAISMLSEQRKVNEDSTISIELQYNNETPDNYEPHNFGASSNANCLRIPQNTHLLGVLRTGYHNLKAMCSQVSNVCLSLLLNGYERPKTPAISLMETEDNLSHQSKRKTIINDEEAADENKKLKHNNLFDASSITLPETGSSFFCMDNEENEHCICGIKFSNIDLFECVKCLHFCHLPCYGLLDKKKSANILCVDCDLANGTITEENLIDKKITAFIRLVLYFYNKTGKVPKELDDMTAEDKYATFKKLKRCKIISKISKKDIHKCKFEEIKLNEDEANATLSLLFSDEDPDSATL